MQRRGRFFLCMGRLDCLPGVVATVRSIWVSLAGRASAPKTLDHEAWISWISFNSLVRNKTLDGYRGIIREDVFLWLWIRQRNGGRGRGHAEVQDCHRWSLTRILIYSKKLSTFVGSAVGRLFFSADSAPSVMAGLDERRPPKDAAGIGGADRKGVTNGVPPLLLAYGCSMCQSRGWPGRAAAMTRALRSAISHPGPGAIEGAGAVIQLQVSLHRVPNGEVLYII